MKHSKFYIAPTIAMLFTSVVFAQQFQKPAAGGKSPFAQNSAALRQNKYFHDSKEMLKIAGTVAPTISESTVTIVSGNRQIALGTIVSPEGHILTKAGSLRKNVKVVIAGQEHVAQLIGIHRGTDLAMLKIDASELPAVKLAQAGELQHGSWLISYGPGKDPVALGVFAGLPIKRRAALGVMLDKKAVADGGTPDLVIQNVISGSPAARASLWVNDVILSIDGIEVGSVAQMQTLIRARNPHDQIKLSIARGNEELTIPVELAESYRPSTTARRRLYFEHAFEHDSKLPSNQCGGPIVNLSGQIVGINVLNPARIPGRIPLRDDSYASLALAIPINEVIPIIESLKSGELAPGAVNQDRIELLVRKVTEMRDSLSDLSEKEEKLTASIKDIEESIQRQQDAFRLVRRKSRELQRQLKLVEKELERLRGGFDY